MKIRKTLLFLSILLISVITLYAYSREIHWWQRKTKISYVMNRNAAVSLQLPLELNRTWVILLERDLQRKSYVLDNLCQQQDMPQLHTIFSAVDGKALTRVQVADFVKQGILTQTAAARLRPGEIGCALSHHALWQKVAADPSINAALILEDDVVLCSDFQSTLAQLSRQLPADFDMVFLYNDNAHTQRAKTQSEQVTIPVYPSCSHAYIVSKAGARKLLQSVFPIDCAIDNAISRYFRAQFNTKNLLKNLYSHFSAIEKEQFLFIYTLQPALIQLRSMPSNTNELLRMDHESILY